MTNIAKIHEHDNKPAQGLALIYNNKIMNIVNIPIITNPKVRI